MSNSPDIILNGTGPVLHLEELETKENYAKEPPMTMIVGSNETNYIYMRAINTASENKKGRMWLWYAEPSMLLWPQEWMYLKFRNEGVGKNWTDVEATANQIIVGNVFELVNPTAPGDHYCMIGIVQSPIPNLEVPEQPFPGYFSNLQQFAAWIEKSPYAAWRNTIDVSRSAATWNTSFKIPGPKEEEEFLLGVQCKKMPVGAKYRYVVPAGRTPEGKEYPGLDSGLREIVKSNESTSLYVNWPAGVMAQMTIYYFAEGKTAETGAIINPSIGTESAGLEGILDNPMRGATETLAFKKPGDTQTATIVRQHVVGGVPIRLVEKVE